MVEDESEQGGEERVCGTLRVISCSGRQSVKVCELPSYAMKSDEAS